jgi:Na+/proline symporter
VLGWNEIVTIFVIGLSTTAYTMLGGVQAVTWTDVKQMVIILVGIGLCLTVIVASFPESVSLQDGLFLAGAVGKLETIDLSFDLSERYTVWSGMIAGLFLFLAYFGCDQSQVQRFLTARSVDEGRVSLLMSAFLKIPLQFLILMMGVLIFVFYHFQPPPMIFNEVEAQRAALQQPTRFAELEDEFATVYSARRVAAMKYVAAREGPHVAAARNEYVRANAAYVEQHQEATAFVRQANNNRAFTDVNYVFPSFVVSSMPIGIVGLIIAAILAAAMSSVAAELNSLATASTMDFYKRHFRPESSEKQMVLFGRMATLVWGIFACIVATFATNLGSLIEVVNTFGSFFYGSLLGVFVLAFAVPGARARGAFYGLLFGIVSVWIASAYTDVAFLWFNVVGCLVTVATGSIISFAFRDSR